MDIQKIVNQYLKRKTDNVILDIIFDKENIIMTNDMTKISKILKYIFVNNMIVDKKIINDATYYAVYNNLYLIVKVLLKYGKANPNHIFSNGMISNLIDEACDMYHCKIAKLLFDYGARGDMWCSNKAQCNEFLNQYCKSDDNNEKIIHKAKLYQPPYLEFSRGSNYNFEKKNIPKKTKQKHINISLNYDNIVIY